MKGTTLALFFVLLLCYSFCYVSTLQVKNLKITSCSKPNSLLKINSVQFPSVIPFPGKISATINMAFLKTIKAPLSATVTLQSYIKNPLTGKWTWFTLPCVANLGSCTYTDMCPTLSKMFPSNKPCPAPLPTLGLPCNCPIPANSINKKNVALTLPAFPFASFVTSSGNFSVSMNLWTGTSPITCFNATFTVSV